MSQAIIVFDTECAGLLGEAFAVGWVRFEGGREVSSGRLHCPHATARPDGDQAWVLANVVPHQREAQRLPGDASWRDTPAEVRDLFWRLIWEPARAAQVPLWADWGWPCEARFLLDCVADKPSRTFEGPTPLHEVSTVQAVAANLGHVPKLVRNAVDRTLPAHDPVADARFSGLQLLEAWAYLADLQVQVVRQFRFGEGHDG